MESHLIKIDTWEFIKGILGGMWLIIKIAWPFLLVVFLIKIFERLALGWIDKWKNKVRFKSGQKWRSDRDLLRWLREMKPSEFEEYIADLFSKLGYKTKAVGGSHDGGIDVIVEKDGIKHFIQCKKFITQEVGVGAMRDFYGAIADHLAHGKGYFITTNKFTLEAEKFAEDKPIEMIDDFKLIDYIHLAEKSNNENNLKICPKCGGTLKERAGKYGKFLGCANYPKCQYAENIENLSRD